MKRLLATLLVVVMALGCSVSAFAYNGDPTSYGNYGYGNYGYDNYGYNNYGYGYYDGWRNDYDNRDYPTEYWFESYEEEIDVDIQFGVYPNNAITRDEVGATIGKAANMSYEEAGKKFSTRYGVPYPDFTWSQDLWEIAGGLYQKRIMNGYPDNTFRGRNNVTRGEFAKILVTTLQNTGLYNNISIGFTFSDMENHWASKYASECQALGLFNGYPDGSFHPDENVTYLQFVAVMIRLTQIAENSRYAINFDHMAYGITTSMNIDIEGYEYSNEDFDLAVYGSKTVYLGVGESVELKVKATPSDIELDNNDIEWEASKSGYVKFSNEDIENDRYATVKIKALKEGKVTVTAMARKDDDISASFNVVISDEEYDDDETYVTSITLNPTSLNLKVGESKSITATVRPTNATNKNIVWKSHNKSVATVDQNGKITAVGVGNTTITAEAEDGSGVIATIEVTVTAEQVIADNKAPEVQITGANVINRDEFVTLTVTAYDENLASFELKKSDILGMTGAGVSVHNIVKVSDTKYEVTLLGVEVSIGEVCVAAGVAVDEAGNASAETDGVVIKVNAND